MLAVVRTPRTEISLHGAGTSQVLEFLRKQFTVEILDVDTSSVEDDGDELVNIRDTDFWSRHSNAHGTSRLSCDLQGRECSRRMIEIE